MKIAAVSEDGVTISHHFGRAPFYVVITVEEGKVVAREKRAKLGHSHFAGGQHGEEAHEAHGADPRGHGLDAASQDRHASMVAAISDCQVLLSRGMGAGAYQSISQAGIRPMVTDIASIDAAISAYLAGKLTDHTERLH